MDPSLLESSLRRRILGILAATAPLAAAVAACGSNNNNDCKSMCCNLPPPQTYTVTYTECPPIVLDASDDADAIASDAASDTDAGDAGDGGDAAPPAPQCFYDCQSACDSQKPYTTTGGMAQCTSQVGDGGQTIAQCEILQLCGRRLDGLVDAPRGGSSAIGEVLARAAWLEAASIHAFRRLARELQAHGAPDALVRAARASARDEARHARAMARLAKRHGATVPRVVVDDCGPRDLEAIARENAIEACVGETYGALLASWQAVHAHDAEVRDAMREIAPDELRHAALGWAIAAWTETQLSEEARERVRRARDEAARAMLQNASIDPEPRVAEVTGVPRAVDATRLATRMSAELWA